MLTVEKLRELGCDVDDGLKRCLNDESFYLGLVPKALDRARFESLDSAVKRKDYEAAFEEAHALKGVLANLSLTPLYEIICQITELLRAKTDTDYTSYLASMWDTLSAFEV